MRMRLKITSLLALMVIVVSACTNQTAAYVVEVRKAGAHASQVERKRANDLEAFLTAFHTFPWREQVGIATEGTEPSLKVTHSANRQTAFFVSVVGDKEYMSYVVGLIYPREMPVDSETDTPSSTDPGTETVQWAELSVVKPLELVESYAAKYFAGDMDALLVALRKAPPFLDAPASELQSFGEES